LTQRPSKATGKVLLATKVAPGFLSGDTEARLDAAFLDTRFSNSLQRLSVDGIELLYTHRPDDATPIEDTLEGLEAIRASGRCRQLGACNVDAVQLTTALDAAERLGIPGYQVVQNQYSLLQPEEQHAVRSVCADRDVAFTAYSPLASGALTGKYPRDGELPADSRLALRPDGNEKLLTPATHDAIDRLRNAADGHGVECGALALAWLLHQADVSAPIIGPARLRPHLGLAASALDVSLSDDEATEIASWFA
jgi:aryl-alcohol dehydrogenase-like predicted oxidoreductase